MLAQTPAGPDPVRALDHKLSNLRATLYETINSHYKEYINTYQYCTDLQVEVVAVANEVDQLVEQTSDATRDMQEPYNITSDREFQWIQRQLIESQSVAFALGLLVKLHSHLQDFDNLVETGEFPSAATSVMEMHSMLERLSLAKGNRCDPAIYKLLKNDFLKKRSSLKHRLEELFASAIVFSRKNNIAELTVTFRPAVTFAKKYYDTPVTVDDLLASFAIMDMLPQKLEAFTRRLLCDIVTPLVRDPVQELTTTRNKLHATLKVGRAGLAGANGGTNGKVASPVPADITTTLNKLLDLGRFLATYLFRPDSTPVTGVTCMSVLGQIWWPQLWRELKVAVLEPSIPDDRAMLAKYEATVEGAIDFETEMMALELIPPDQFLISRFIRDVETVYAQRKRSDLLAMAREILLSEDHNTVEVTHATERGGFSISSESKNQPGSSAPDKPGAEKNGKEGAEVTEGAFRLPTCHVTVQTQTLVELAYQTLNGATQADETDSIELFYSARDLFDLFRAVVPVRLAGALEYVPLRSALFHNDCIYICYHLLTLGYQFKDRLPGPLDQTATFVDMIPPFRRLGETCFRGQMRRQRDLLRDTIESANGFHNTADDARFGIVEKVVKQAFFQLNQLAAAWKPVLPTEMFFKSMGILLDTLLEDLMRQVLQLPSVASNETHQLRYVMGLLEKAEAWYEIRSGIGKSKVVEKMSIRKYVRLWDKYWQLAELLEVTPSELAHKQEIGRLEDFSREELDALTNALFSETHDRAEFGLAASTGVGAKDGTTGKEKGRG